MEADANNTSTIRSRAFGLLLDAIAPIFQMTGRPWSRLVVKINSSRPLPYSSASCEPTRCRAGAKSSPLEVHCWLLHRQRLRRATAPVSRRHRLRLFLYRPPAAAGRMRGPEKRMARTMSQCSLQLPHQIPAGRPGLLRNHQKTGTESAVISSARDCEKVPRCRDTAREISPLTCPERDIEKAARVSDIKPRLGNV